MTIQVLTQGDTGFAAGAAAVAALFAAREAEFVFTPDIDRLNPAFDDFAADHGRSLPPDLVAILTTWADYLRPLLIRAGFIPKNRPSGPPGRMARPSSAGVAQSR